MVLKNISVDFNFKKINKKQKDIIKILTPEFTQEILKDINYFAPQLTGNLIGSSLLATNFKEGRIIYNTKYANRLHNSPKIKNISTRINKNAKKSWVDYAYNKYKDKWMQKLNKLMKLV